ncbi:hypothetical protein ESOMN_v1c02990 [Williamsoniiplasma somnilux]|uniref:Lipoprotein n=1 Tax=Williamsoniiplasma somnilux TaxID=215578 RepID=A0A2K8P100_9MOLU|nr:lipoprotein [Williamsoniiplasma somnilux]ATZ18681.1 hypothetical protein ESOMN_v1c02990 [Williamsoniiplasma somnilux]
MKKMLSILGVIGLTATAGFSVVACGTSNSEFDNIMNFINATRGHFDEEGNPIIGKEAATSILYIGAKDSTNSKSFEFALTHNTKLKVSSLEKANEELNNSNSGWATLKNPDKDQMTMETEAIINTDTNSEKYGEVKEKSKIPLYGMKNKDNSLSEKLSFNSLILESWEQFGNSNTFSKLINDYLKTDILVQYQSLNNTSVGPTGQNAKTAMEEIIKKIEEQFKKGPLFLIFTNGHFTGLVNGWKDYYKTTEPINKELLNEQINDWENNISEIIKSGYKGEKIISKDFNNTNSFSGVDTDSKWDDDLPPLKLKETTYKFNISKKYAA